MNPYRLLTQVQAVTKLWVAIIDHSIDIGTKKALVVLRVEVGALSKRGSAIRLEECFELSRKLPRNSKVKKCFRLGANQ